MSREVISTKDAPQAIGTYSQAVKVNKTVYLSGQIPLDPVSMKILDEDIESQICRVFDNLKAVVKAANGKLSNIVKINIYLIDLENFGKINNIMKKYFQEPYPARAVVQVAKLPKDANIEIDAVMELD
tara:strand:- start:1332 stop:1715 length:384 start_codon:yes stop_codon:yes gene_type:complete